MMRKLDNFLDSKKGTFLLILSFFIIGYNILGILGYDANITDITNNLPNTTPLLNEIYINFIIKIHNILTFRVIIGVSSVYLGLWFINMLVFKKWIMINDMVEVLRDNKDNLYLYGNKIDYEKAHHLVYMEKCYSIKQLEDGKIELELY